MLEFTTTEVAVLVLSAAGIAAGLWFVVTERTPRAWVALAAAVLIPVLGPLLALVGAALHLLRHRRREAAIGS